MAKKLAIMVHGIRCYNVETSPIGRLAPYLQQKDYEVIDFDYGFIDAFQALILYHKLADRLRTLVNTKLALDYDMVVMVGHSNGAAVVEKAMRNLPEQSKTQLNSLLIDAALDSWRVAAGKGGRMVVWHSPDDEVVKMSKFIPWCPWGDMGAYGYRFPGEPYKRAQMAHDIEIYNVNSLFVGMNHFPSLGHSGVFDEDKIAFFGPKIVQSIEQAEENMFYTTGLPIDVVAA